MLKVLLLSGLALAVAITSLHASARRDRTGGGYKRGADHNGPGHRPHQRVRTRTVYRDRTIYRHDYGYPHHYPRRYPRTSTTVSCAPEVKQANVAAAEAAMAKMAKQSNFASATLFQSAVTELLSMTNVDSKIDALFGLVNIDASNIDEVAHFIGAREVSVDAVEAAANNLELTNEQALQLLEELQKEFRGNL